MVWTPLKNISQLGWLFPIYGKIKNVPNHQPVHLSVSGKPKFHLTGAESPSRRTKPETIVIFPSFLWAFPVQSSSRKPIHWTMDKTVFPVFQKHPYLNIGFPVSKILTIRFPFNHQFSPTTPWTKPPSSSIIFQASNNFSSFFSSGCSTLTGSETSAGSSKPSISDSWVPCPWPLDRIALAQTLGKWKERPEFFSDQSENFTHDGSMYGVLMLTKLGFLLMVNVTPWSLQSHTDPMGTGRGEAWWTPRARSGVPPFEETDFLGRLLVVN